MRKLQLKLFYSSKVKKLNYRKNIYTIYAQLKILIGS